MTTTIQSLKII